MNYFNNHIGNSVINLIAYSVTVNTPLRAPVIQYTDHINFSGNTTIA